MLRDSHSFCDSFQTFLPRESSLTSSFLSLLKSILNIFYDSQSDIEAPRNSKDTAKTDQKEDDSSLEETVTTPDDIHKYFEEYHNKVPKDEDEEENETEGSRTEGGRKTKSALIGLQLTQPTQNRSEKQTDERGHGNDIDSLSTFL